MPRIMSRQSCQVKAQQASNPKKQNSLTAETPDRTMTAANREVLYPIIGQSVLELAGGDTASTGVKTRGMHAEPHRLVNPMEHNVTANTQLPLAA